MNLWTSRAVVVPDGAFRSMHNKILEFMVYKGFGWLLTEKKFKRHGVNLCHPLTSADVMIGCDVHVIRYVDDYVCGNMVSPATVEPVVKIETFTWVEDIIARIP